MRLNIPPFIFFAIISDPASPNPSANNAPIFIINFYRITVSIFSSSFFFAISSLLPYSSRFSIIQVSVSSILADSSGFSEIFFTFSSILLIGSTTNSSTSLDSIIAPPAKTIDINIVRQIENIASNFVLARKSALAIATVAP